MFNYIYIFDILFLFKTGLLLIGHSLSCDYRSPIFVFMSNFCNPGHPFLSQCAGKYVSHLIK